MSDFWSGRGATRTEREQFSPEEWDRISTGISEEGTAGKNGIGEIDVAFVLGDALSGIYDPDGRLGEVEDEKAGKDLWRTRSGFFV